MAKETLDASGIGPRIALVKDRYELVYPAVKEMMEQKGVFNQFKEEMSEEVYVAHAPVTTRGGYEFDLRELTTKADNSPLKADLKIADTAFVYAMRPFVTKVPVENGVEIWSRAHRYYYPSDSVFNHKPTGSKTSEAENLAAFFENGQMTHKTQGSTVFENYGMRKMALPGKDSKNIDYQKDGFYPFRMLILHGNLEQKTEVNVKVGETENIQGDTTKGRNYFGLEFLAVRVKNYNVTITSNDLR